jgi:hypothetical protein
LRDAVGWTLLFPLKTAGVAQLVEHHLAKVDVASSSLVTRFNVPCICGTEEPKCAGLKRTKTFSEHTLTGQLVILRRPGRKRLELEIVCRSWSNSSVLIKEFGGRIEVFPT